MVPVPDVQLAERFGCVAEHLGEPGLASKTLQSVSSTTMPSWSFSNRAPAQASSATSFWAARRARFWVARGVEQLVEVLCQARDLVALAVLGDAGPVVALVDRRHGAGDAGQPAGDVPRPAQKETDRASMLQGEEGPTLPASSHFWWVKSASESSPRPSR